MRPPRLGVSYSEAIAAAYASAPEEEVLLDTLELYHPLWGPPVRVVNDHVNFVAYLEAGAPHNAGQQVTFSACSFSFARPEESDSSAPPEVQLSINNVSRLLMPFLQLAVTSRTPIAVIWRPYLASDPSGPHMLPSLQLTLRNVTADMMTMKGRAGFVDTGNRRFPNVFYTPQNFPGLTYR